MKASYQWGEKNNANSWLCMVGQKTCLGLLCLLGGLYTLTYAFNTLELSITIMFEILK